MSRNKIKIAILAILITSALVACSNLIPTSLVWLKVVDFEVDPQANRGASFVCHITVAYSQDLFDKLSGMKDAKVYFENISSLKKIYKDNIEIFQYDLIPGKNQINKQIKLRSYTKAKGAFIFAKYTTPGKYMENIGLARERTVRFLPNKMELHSDISLEKLTDAKRK